MIQSRRGKIFFNQIITSVCQCTQAPRFQYFPSLPPSVQKRQERRNIIGAWNSQIVFLLLLLHAYIHRGGRVMCGWMPKSRPGRALREEEGRKGKYSWELSWAAGEKSLSSLLPAVCWSYLEDASKRENIFTIHLSACLPNTYLCDRVVRFIHFHVSVQFAPEGFARPGNPGRACPKMPRKKGEGKGKRGS